MEEALILVVTSPSFDFDSMSEIKKISGVQDANLIYGAYDMFVKIKTESMNEVRSAVLSLREMPGIKSTLTCNVINE